MTHEKLFKLALDALELVNLEFVCGNGSHHKKEDRHEWDEDCPITDRWRKAIAALKEALAQPEQEPVGTVKDLFKQAAWERLDVRGSTKVYLDIPPQRTWVGLTDYEIGVCSTEAAMNRNDMVGGAIIFAKSIEAKLKEKNT